MDKPKRRVDEAGRAYAGSQLQTQIYVSHRPAELSAAVAEAIDVDPAGVTWVAPRSDHGYKEPMDGRFLDALGLPHLRPALRKFWPRRGPSWDALGVALDREGEPTFILAEGKSYPAEMLGGGCAAGEDSLRLIKTSLAETKVFFGVEGEVDWTGACYQYANRLAHVHFLRRETGRQVWLVNLCFTDDQTRNPTPRGAWEAGLVEIKKRLGFGGTIPFSADVFLPGLARTALFESAAK